MFSAEIIPVPPFWLAADADGRPLLPGYPESMDPAVA
jgi:hypothetical protein